MWSIQRHSLRSLGCIGGRASLLVFFISAFLFLSFEIFNFIYLFTNCLSRAKVECIPHKQICDNDPIRLKCVCDVGKLKCFRLESSQGFLFLLLRWKCLSTAAGIFKIRPEKKEIKDTGPHNSKRTDRGLHYIYNNIRLLIEHEFLCSEQTACLENKIPSSYEKK